MGGRGSGGGRAASGPQMPQVGTEGFIGKGGLQRWRVLGVRGEMVTIRGVLLLSSGRTQTREVHISKFSWKGKDQ